MAKNTIKSVSIRIATTPGVWALLEKLTQTHRFGKNEAETAERILQQAVFALSDEKLRGMQAALVDLDLSAGESEVEKGKES
ncbi:MAG: hypothetical protein ABI769_10205 [Pseudomonadota bacterium]